MGGPKISVLASHLMQRADLSSHMARRVFCVILLAVFFVNPLTFFLPHGESPVGNHAGSMRSLSGLETSSQLPEPVRLMDSITYLLLWAMRLLVAAAVFGWMALRSFPTVAPNSKGAVQFWRYKMQAEKDVQKVC